MRHARGGASGRALEPEAMGSSCRGGAWREQQRGEAMRERGRARARRVRGAATVGEAAAGRSRAARAGRRERGRRRTTYNRDGDREGGWSSRRGVGHGAVVLEVGVGDAVDDEEDGEAAIQVSCLRRRRGGEIRRGRRSRMGRRGPATGGGAGEVAT
nr:octapeptide-repeat protein T2-like [Aegilops tauschii subsp. strangulata]